MRYLYIYFHLNLNFSALYQKDIISVIKNSYFNLFNEIDKCDVQVGIEISGYSLDLINKKYPKILLKIRQLIKKNKIELIGSGYHQIISPLFSKDIVEHNLKEGIKTYKKYFKIIPRFFLVNEQVFNESLIENYFNCGVYNLLFDYQNNTYKSYTYLTSQPAKYKYKNKNLNFYWSHSIFSQTIQDYIYKKIDDKKYLSCIKQITKKNGVYCIYGSDAETFDFRMNRYDYEVKTEEKEYEKLFNIIKSICDDREFKFLNFLDLHNFNKNYIKLDFLNIKNPYQIKKQEKYNISRWINTSHFSAYINSLLVKNSSNFKYFSPINKNIFLYLCSSDLRTHASDDKLKKVKKLLKELKLKKLNKNILPRKSMFYDGSLSINQLPILKNKSILIKSFTRTELLKFNITNNYYSYHSVITDYEKVKKYTDLNNKFKKIKKSYLAKYTNDKIKYFKKLEFSKQKVNIKLSLVKNELFKGYFRLPITFIIKIKKKIFLEYKSSGSEVIKYLIKPTSYITNKFEFFSVNQMIYSTNGIMKISNGHECITFKNNIEFSNLPFLIETIKYNKEILFRVYISILELDDTKIKKSENIDLNLDIFLND